MSRRKPIPFRIKFLLSAIALIVAMLALLQRQELELRRNLVTIYRRLFDNPHQYKAIIAAAAERHAVDSRLIYAVISKESGFDHDIVGSVGEIGLMQIRPTTAAADWAKAHGYPVPVNGLLFTPELNIEIGTWYLAQAIQRWRNYDHALELALCAYNAGDAKAREWQPATLQGELKEITYPTTRQYVKDIMKHYRKLSD